MYRCEQGEAVVFREMGTWCTARLSRAPNAVLAPPSLVDGASGVASVPEVVSPATRTCDRFVAPGPFQNRCSCRTILVCICTPSRATRLEHLSASGAVPLTIRRREC
jgi:hypothetical protein